MATTQNPEVAKLLYDYILSKEGQKTLVREYAMPISMNVEVDRGWLNPSDAHARMHTVYYQFLIEERTEIIIRFNKIFSN